MIISITLAVLSFVYAYFQLQCLKCKSSTVAHFLSTSVGSFGELGLQIALIVLYSSTLSIFNEINIDALNYYANNNCSDGPL